jgi:hypothetical protein
LIIPKLGFALSVFPAECDVDRHGMACNPAVEIRGSLGCLKWERCADTSGRGGSNGAAFEVTPSDSWGTVTDSRADHSA